MLKNKTLLFIMMISIFALIMAGCTKKEDAVLSKGEETPISKNYVKPGEVTKKFDNGETFAFTIVDKDCSACKMYKEETLTDFEKQNLGDIKLIEINKIVDREEEFSQLTDLIQTKLDNQFEATPTTYFVRDGKLVDVVVGAIGVEELQSYYDKVVNTKYEDVSDDAKKEEEPAEEDTSSK